MQPQMGENIGAAARAMANFGLNDLRLVAPRDGWPNEKADAMAAGALEVIKQVRVFDTLEEAMADLHYVLATTARPRDMVKQVFTPRGAVEALHLKAAESVKTAILFGPERSGLENDHLARVQGIITIPTAPDFSSINLGQSALLMAYEWWQAQDHTAPFALSFQASPVAHQDEVALFLTRLKSLLENGGFFKSPDLKPQMTRNIDNLFSRQQLSVQEVNMLQGMISALSRN